MQCHWTGRKSSSPWPYPVTDPEQVDTALIAGNSWKNWPWKAAGSWMWAQDARIFLKPIFLKFWKQGVLLEFWLGVVLWPLPFHFLMGMRPFGTWNWAASLPKEEFWGKILTKSVIFNSLTVLCCWSTWKIEDIWLKRSNCSGFSCSVSSSDNASRGLHSPAKLHHHQLCQRGPRQAGLHPTDFWAV